MKTKTAELPIADVATVEQAEADLDTARRIFEEKDAALRTGERHVNLEDWQAASARVAFAEAALEGATAAAGRRERTERMAAATTLKDEAEALAAKKLPDVVDAFDATVKSITNLADSLADLRHEQALLVGRVTDLQPSQHEPDHDLSQTLLAVTQGVDGNRFDVTKLITAAAHAAFGSQNLNALGVNARETIRSWSNFGRSELRRLRDVAGAATGKPAQAPPPRVLREFYPTGSKTPDDPITGEVGETHFGSCITCKQTLGSEDKIIELSDGRRVCTKCIPDHLNADEQIGN